MFELESFPVASKGSLSAIAHSHSLRCDSKQFEKRFMDLESTLSNKECCYLAEFIPDPLVKGQQHTYLQEGEGVPVVNTLSIQKLRINTGDCRYISEADFEQVNESRKLKKGDVLLTMDGGTSIGKPVLFDLDGEYTLDSHVAIIRPVGISPKEMVYLLASPLGQLQFQKFESGASGQTAVTEEDLRRFRVPRSSIDKLSAYVDTLDQEKLRIEQERTKLDFDEGKMWEDFTMEILD